MKKNRESFIEELLYRPRHFHWYMEMDVYSWHVATSRSKHMVVQWIWGSLYWVYTRLLCLSGLSLLWYTCNPIKKDTFVSLVLTLSYKCKVLLSSQAGCMMTLWGMQANQTRSIPAWSQTLWRVILRLREMMSHFKYRTKSTHDDRDRTHLADTSQLEVIGLNRVLHLLMLSYMQKHYYCWIHSQHCFSNDVFVCIFYLELLCNTLSW